MPHLELIPLGKREALKTGFITPKSRCIETSLLMYLSLGGWEAGIRPVKQEGRARSLDGSMTDRRGEWLNEVPGNLAPRG